MYVASRIPRGLPSLSLGLFRLVLVFQIYDIQTWKLYQVLDSSFCWLLSTCGIHFNEELREKNIYDGLKRPCLWMNHKLWAKHKNARGFDIAGFLAFIYLTVKTGH
jgi:hypothetical protein